jgi:hypothetical protein
MTSGMHIVIFIWVVVAVVIAVLYSILHSLGPIGFSTPILSGSIPDLSF